MTETVGTAGGEVFRDPTSLDPFEIGREAAPSPRKVIRRPFSKPSPGLTESEWRGRFRRYGPQGFPKPLPSLTESERRDLLSIDTGNMTLDDIREYTRSLVIDFERQGYNRRIRYSPAVLDWMLMVPKPEQLKQFREVIRVDSWLEKGQYDKVAALFLQKAREEWSTGRRNEKGDTGDDYMYHISGIEAVATIPWSVQAQGDSAIKQFLIDSEGVLHLRMGKTNPATYLRRAAVLARLINKTTQEQGSK